MRKNLLTISLIACTFNVTLASQAFSATLTNQTQEPDVVTLYAAGSLRGALSEVADSFTQKYGIIVKREFASSGSLRERLEKGENADVFASADTGNPTTLNQKKLSGTVKTFASNPLYAIAPSSLSLTSDNLLDQLLNPQIKLGTAVPVGDPLGDYTQEIFRKADQIKPGSFQILDTKAVRLTGTLPPDRNSPGGSIVYYLEDTNQADIYPVYYTSALSAVEISPNLQIVPLPDNLAVKANYGLTVLKDANPYGEKLAQYILSPTGQQILAKYGFSKPSTPIPEPSSMSGIFLTAGIGIFLKKKSTSGKKQQLKVSVHQS
ncbi:MAG: molybdate ABC transporter substrate-binding protein [Tolypothrix carrinoi HA7290-LM1]|jgi:molybdenum ABC transporter molybdate-binding protein|nr:molybdate ABC transporter substrate-binding protein [Tolypothrix carrinoi HA7290-LM1]